jgi:hypothetical protein
MLLSRYNFRYRRKESGAVQLDNGLIFIECKRVGKFEGAKGQQEMNDAELQLRSLIHAHLERAAKQAANKPKTVLGVVTDGNRWLLIGINKINVFHNIAGWAFLTDDPRIIAQRMWLLAKPALAQPTSALVEFLARHELAEILKEEAKKLKNRVNDRLPDGDVSEELVTKWLREAFPDPALPSCLASGDSSPPLTLSTEASALPTGPEVVETPAWQKPPPEPPVKPERYDLRKNFWEGLFDRCKVKNTRHANITPGEFGWSGAGSGVRGLPFTYTIRQEESEAALFIDRGPGKKAENKEIFDRIHKHKEEIEKAFGGELSWQRLEDKQGCRIAYITTAGGYRSDEAKWPEIQDAMIEAMMRLEKALVDHLLPSVKELK